jgi:1,4-alpha-glucan branching enzyme
VRRLAAEIARQEVDLSVTTVDRWVTLLNGPRVEEDAVLFLAAFPRAKSVSVTGSFCDWLPAGLPLSLREDGLWERRIPIDPGKHEYRFVVDGAWLPDPHNEKGVANEFGGVNSLVTVPA